MSGGLDVTNLPPGTVLLDKYRVVHTLGVGGMGAVVAAEHLTLGARVAMKFLLPQYVSVQDAAQRFLREARATTRLSSDHVAKVLDVGTLPEGIPYMVMEYLEGQDVARILKAGKRFGVHEAIDAVVQAAEALAQAHRVGIIHRDVKPANLFLTQRSDGRPLVKVLDFGISKVAEEAQVDMNLTKTTAVLGSGLYMSPEQMRSAKNVDHRTDVYALGICLYELLARTQPFVAENFSELCLKVNLDPPDPLRRHRPDVPEALAEAIAKAYARSPDDRYPSMAAFVAALAPFAAPETRPIIEAVQRIGAAGGGHSTIPPSRSLPPPSPPVAATARAVTVPQAPAPAVAKRPSNSFLAIGVGIGLVVAVATFAMLSRMRATPPAAAADPAPPSTVGAGAVTAEPVVSAPPSMPEPPAVEPAQTAAPRPSATAAPAPSATEAEPVSTAASPKAAPTPSIRRKPPAQPQPSAAPPKGPCFTLDKTTGLRVMVPCN